MKRRLAARQADDPGTEIPQLLEAPFELGVRNRPRRLVVLEAVLAGEVTAAGGDPLGGKRAKGGAPATGKAEPLFARRRRGGGDRERGGEEKGVGGLGAPGL